jgi:putative sugar O-methyltransferase
LEIGAGLGRTAYYARQFGIMDYTIIDIPITLISQSYFLGIVLGEEAVLLAGEDAPDRGSRVKILPPSQFLDGEEKYDLILNADSLTELCQTAAKAYWNQIESRCRVFLSINHESNPFTVREFIHRSRCVQSYDRQPYWLRNGYTEEVVRFRETRV